MNSALLIININIDGIDARALYNLGSNISLINIEFIKMFNKKIQVVKEFICNSVDRDELLQGLNLLEIKIFNIKKTWCFVINNKDFEYDLVLSLDMIKAFGRQDKRLIITQT